MAKVKADAKKIIFFQRLKNTIATKLTIWFLLLSLAPLVVLFVFVRGNIEQQFVVVTTQNMYEQTKLLGAEVSLTDDTASIRALFSQNYNKDLESFLVGVNETSTVYFGDGKRFDEVYNTISAELIRQISAKNDGVFVDSSKKWAAAFCKVPDRGFIVITFFDLSDAFLPLYQAEVTGLTQIGATLIAVAIFSGVVIFLTMKPVRDLVKVTERVSSGNLDIQINPSEFEGEMETLATGFNQMLQDLKIYQNQIKGHAEDMEKQVVLRTEELEKSKKELEVKIYELEKFSKMSVGRELRMVELKKRISELEKQLKEK